MKDVMVGRWRAIGSPQKECLMHCFSSEDYTDPQQLLIMLIPANLHISLKNSLRSRM